MYVSGVINVEDFSTAWRHYVYYEHKQLLIGWSKVYSVFIYSVLFYRFFANDV